MFFLAHLAKGHVSYCHHLVSVIVVIRHSRLSSSLIIFQNSSLKLLDQLELNLVWVYLGVSCIELVWGFLIRQKTWPSLLKIVVFLHISPKQLGLAKFWHWGKSVQHDDIYLRSNFHFNLFSHVGVTALFQGFLLFFMLFLQKNLLLWHYLTNWNQTWFESSFGYPA